MHGYTTRSIIVPAASELQHNNYMTDDIFGGVLYTNYIIMANGDGQMSLKNLKKIICIVCQQIFLWEFL